MLVVPEVFSSFLPLVLFLHLVILREKNGGVFQTFLLFVQFMAERDSPWRGRVSYPCIEALL